MEETPWPGYTSGSGYTPVVAADDNDRKRKVSSIKSSMSSVLAVSPSKRRQGNEVMFQEIKLNDTIDENALDSLYDYDVDELALLEEAAGISKQSVENMDVEERIALLKKKGCAKLLTKPSYQRTASVGGKWTVIEDTQLKEIVSQHGPRNWKKIAALLGPTRTDVQCLHRWNKVLKPGLHKGSWSEEEDKVVRDAVNLHGISNIKWSLIAAKLPGRIGKQCRERWFNHLDPAIKKGDWNADEDMLLFESQRHFGNRWCEISKILPGRTENAVKNRWNSSTMKKWLKDNNLIPGNGTPLQDLSLEGMHSVLISFCDILGQKGIKMDYNYAAEKLGFGDLLEPGGNALMKGDPNKKIEKIISEKTERAKQNKVNSKSIPAHLRPTIIDTNMRNGDSSLLLIDMLHNLKTTPSPLNELLKKEKKGKNRKNKQMLSNLWPPMCSDIQSSASRAHQIIQELLNDSKGRGKGKVSKKREQKLIHEVDPSQFVPFSSLSDYFSLSEATQLQLVKQLIERFQRTSCTPRYAMLPTPRVDGINDSDLFGIDILGSPRGLGMMGAFGDTSVFEMPDDDILTSHIPMGISTHWPNLSDSLPSPLSVKIHTSMISSQPTSTRSSKFQSSLGQLDTSIRGSINAQMFDDTAVDAAVAVVVEIVNKLPQADQFLKLLSTSENVGGSSIPTPAMIQSASSLFTVGVGVYPEPAGGRSKRSAKYVK